MVGRKTHAVHQQLPFVERAEIGSRGVAKSDDAEQFIIDRIDDRYRVRKLVGRVETIFVTDRDVRRARCAGGLAGKRRNDTAKQKRRYKVKFHSQTPCAFVEFVKAATQAVRSDCAASVQFLAAVRR